MFRQAGQRWKPDSSRLIFDSEPTNRRSKTSSEGKFFFRVNQEAATDFPMSPNRIASKTVKSYSPDP